MTRLEQTLGASALLYPQNLNLHGRAFLFIPLTEAAYRHHAFLDDRILEAETPRTWLTEAAVNQALVDAAVRRPVHFIFHTGHAGSTLVSRLLDWLAPTLPLREPLPLRHLCDALDREPIPAPAAAQPDLRAMWETTWRLWGRGFAETRAVIVKATSACARHALPILDARTDSRAVYLGLHAEPHLATLLSKPGTLAADLQGFRAERWTRLTRLLGFEPPPALMPGELAAMSWLCESLTRRRAIDRAGGRILAVDFDELLAEPRQHLHSLVRHLGLPADEQRLQNVEGCPLFRQYSKATEYAYTPALRRELLAQTRQAQRREIRRGLRWLEALGRVNAAVGALLAGVGGIANPSGSTGSA